ncbi:hypothetical protein T01_9093, partial [Trichinella spiralis]
LLLTFWSSEPDREGQRPVDSLWIVCGAERDGEGKLDSHGEDLNRMCDESEKAVVIQGQLSLVEKLFEETDALQSAFEEGVEAEEQEASMIEWSGYRLDFLRSQARAQEVAGQGLADRAAPQELKTAEVDPNVRLPRLELPKFDGDVTRFHEFWDQFETSVHRQPGASGATKLAYLRGCLTGAALDTIEGLSASNQGYELALQRLRERFDRPMVAVREQILRLVDLLMTKNKLSTICDEFHKKVYALTALGKDPRTSDLSVAEVLIALCREQLPGSVQFRWDELAQANNAVVADLPAFLRFLQQLTDLPGASRRSKEPTRETTKARRSGATFLHAAVERSCYICQKQHLPQQCPSLLRAGPHQRRELARRARLCFACLEPGHYASGCKHRGKTTDGKPVPASSPSTSASERSVAEQKTIVRSEEPSSAPVHANVATRSSQWTSRLQTVRAVAYGEQGQGKRVTCLLDTASERSFVRQDLASALGLVGQTSPLSLVRIGGILHEIPDAQLVKLWLGRADGRSAERHPLQALTMPKLCNNLCNTRLRTDDWEHLRPLGLAMDDCPDSDQVDVVIGIDSYYRFLGNQIRRGGPEDPVAVESVLGWIICGPVIANPSSPMTTTLCASVDQGIDRTLRRFWEIEEIGVGSKGDPEMSEQEKSFRDSLSFDGTRYSVRLLKKSGEMNLPNNFELARRRLGAVERRLAQDPVRREQYASIFQDYLKNGWAEQVNDEGKSGRTWYLPHHVVYQQGPEGQKARIVFDGSAKYQGTSLNDHLDAGPKVQTDLMGILLRFRRYRVALQSDIAKMYLQVGLHEDERDFCRFLWRDRSGTLDIYRLTRVCFGLACSPYLAIQVVNSHLEAHRTLFPSVADEIRSCMYVDDLVVSRDSVADAKLFVHQASDLLSRGGFHLTKWASNAPEALSDLPAEDCSSVDRSRLWKTLGISWNPQLDQLSICPPSQAASETHGTKRGLLRLAASVFDPLGALTPFTVRAKQLLQSLWQTGISWDDPLPPEISRKWDQWRSDLGDLHQIALPRAYLPYSPMEVSRLELHGFGDASEAAYAAVVYLRATQSTGVTRVSFVAAKSKVAPLKKLSVPRLELSAALLCVRLVRYVLQELALPVDACYCWSASLVALGWIRGDACRWKPFVANRVREIQGLLSPQYWGYCPTQDNPADLASRGCSGLTWLRAPPETWPQAEKEERTEGLGVLEEERRATTALVAVSPPQDAATVIDPGRYSSFERLIRVTAWCRRFRHNTTLPAGSRRAGTALMADELKAAERIWIRQEQIHAFGSKDPTDKSVMKTLCGLNPFLDEFGVMRVGGRLGRAQLEEEAKFPALLPCKGMIVDLLIEREHSRQLHAGVAQTLAALRERFWILHGRSAVKRVLRTCRLCRRVAARPFEQRMGELPATRVNPAGPFSNVGIDFAGPLMIRDEGSKHGSKKAYICLFTCMVVRAIHLELVPDQTIESFLRALRRFVARRGRPDTIQSDNFRTFHQANVFLKHLFSGQNWETVQRHLASERVEWIFITERAPWCGGYWERLVRSVKTALKATLGQCLASPDELRTVLCEVEARVNDRPLTFVGSDIQEEMALTPAHFLVGRSLTAFPDRSDRASRGTMSSSLRHLLRRWSYQRKLVDAFWKRWQREYVVTLSCRGKWKRLQEQPRVGDVVLVADYNTPRRRWPLGQIVELLTGSDGLARSAKVKTAAGILRRSIRTLILLEPAEAH